MRSPGHRRDVIIRQNNPRRCFHMRRKHHIGARRVYFRHHFVNRRRRKRRARPRPVRPRHHHRHRAGKAAGVKNLAPPIGKPAIAHHKRMLAIAELPRHRLHRVRPAAGHQGHGIGVVNLAQHGRYIAHHTLKPARHMVERPIREYHREFFQPVGVNIWAKSGHPKSSCQGLTAHLTHFSFAQILNSDMSTPQSAAILTAAPAAAPRSTAHSPPPAPPRAAS